MSDHIIYRYTRQQAIRDSVLIPVDELAREAGFKWPVAVTDHLYHRYVVPAVDLVAEGQSITGRIWDVLTVLRFAIQNSKDDTFLRFRVLFQMKPGFAPNPIELVSVCGPGDDGEPVITIMLPDDD
jgi:hypothetical protein